MTGNIFNVEDEQDRALGYFEAASVDTARVFTLKTDFSFVISDPCGFNTLYRHRACNDCLSIENSSLGRPYYYP